MGEDILNPFDSNTDKLLSRLEKIFSQDYSDLLSDLSPKEEKKTKKKVKTFESEIQNKISNLSENNKEALDLISYIYYENGDISYNYKKLLQEKLIFLGYDECPGLILPKDLDEEAIMESIINFYNSIDFDNTDKKVLSFQEKIINNAIREFF